MTIKRRPEIWGPTTI